MATKQLIIQKLINMNKINAKKAAEYLRQQGRDGDTMLAHINPQEAQMLKAMGGSGTINPKTGLPEYKFLGWVGDLVRDPGEALSELDDKVNEEYPGGWEGVAATVAAIMGMNGGFNGFGGSESGAGGFEWLPNGEMTVSGTSDGGASSGSSFLSSIKDFSNSDTAKGIKQAKDYLDIAQNFKMPELNQEEDNNSYSKKFLDNYLSQNKIYQPSSPFSFPEQQNNTDVEKLAKLLKEYYGY